MTEKSEKTLLEFWNSVNGRVETVWFVSLGHPAGKELTHNPDTDDPEEYCLIHEAIEFLGDLDQYSGTVEGVEWQWDGSSGAPTDWNRNTIVNLKVFAIDERTETCAQCGKELEQGEVVTCDTCDRRYQS